MRLLFCLAIFLVPALVLAGDRSDDAGKTYNVPYKLTDTGHVLVRTKLNGKGPYNFIIDTGAPIFIVSDKVGKELDIQNDKKGWTKLERIEIEGGVVNEQFKAKVLTPFQLEGMNAMNFAGAELHGIIGFTLLAQYRMEFDFSSSKMKWTKLKFTPPEPQPAKVKGGEPAGLNAMASLMKIMSFLVGKNESPKLLPRGFLGMVIDQEKEKVLLKEILPESPAAKAGLQNKDRILQVNGMKIDTLLEVQQVTRFLREGQSLSFLVQRGEKEIEISVTAGKGL